jgi:hypothetical protein
MKIRMLTSMAGLDFVHQAGDIIDVEPTIANRYCEAGVAQLVEEEKAERAIPKQKKAETR